MVRRVPQIVAFGGGGFSMESSTLLDDYVLRCTGTERPKVCFVPTASGDADHYIVRFYRAFSPVRCEPSHVSLFRRDRGAGIDHDVAAHLLRQDLIYVGGGSVISLLGVWRAHGLDAVFAEAWERGIVLCGLSAGSLCWFSHAVTAFHGAPQRVRGLGLLPHSNCVHLNDPERHEAFAQHVAEGMPAGYGAQDGAVLHFVGRDLARVVTSRPDAQAYRFMRRRGAVVQKALATEYLGEPAAAVAA
jgi:dipeptidase E